MTRKNIIRQLLDLLLFFMVSLLQSYLMCPRCSSPVFSRVVLFTFLMWMLLWKGNSFLSRFLTAKIPWIHYPVKRFLSGIVLTVSYTVFVVLLLIWAFEHFSRLNLGAGNLYTLYGSILVTILISFFLHARHFLLYWRKASFEKEKFEKESITARYETLKNQVSPHFLFNSLNALSNLIYEDPDKAVKFVKQLSEVYRYVLETREKEVVPLAEELKFLESYLYLQHIRFENKLHVEIGQFRESFLVAPLALQMLIENAIKHNIISDADQLTIRLYAENGFVVVENNLQKKLNMTRDPSSGVGLTNICKRYEFLTNEKVQIVEDQNHFKVKLPALQEINT